MTENTITPREAVQELWQLCNVLRDEGISAQDYVNELTYLLFLKMLHETARDVQLPDGCRWPDISTADDQLAAYRRVLARLDALGPSNLHGIFLGARSALRTPSNVAKLIFAIDQMRWFNESVERIGDIYEGLLERVATDRKSAAGQYFTPRPLVDCIVRVMQPQPGETIQDPAAGTGGFLIGAQQWVKSHGDGGQGIRFTGMELVPDTYRLLAMNLVLHGIDPTDVQKGDTLSKEGEALPKAHLVLTNPPFGTSKGGKRPDRTGFVVSANTSNKQLGFLEHVVNTLMPGGRAAVLVPDNVLFASGPARDVRTWILDHCRLHTILRLPSGIFYAQGIKTSVLFLQKTDAQPAATDEVWIYDMRAGLPAFSRARPLRPEDFAEFIKLYGKDPNGRSDRSEAASEERRFRSFKRDEISERQDNLDLNWLQEIDASEEALEEPGDLVEAIRGHLQRALAGLDELEGFASGQRQ